MTHRCYSIPGAITIDAIRSELTRLFDGIRELAGTETVEVLDSFDWRLFKKGWLLLKTQKYYTIVDIHSRQQLARVAADERKPRRFHWKFPESKVAACLGDTLEMRALLPLGEIKKQWIDHDLLNSDEKIVARLTVETYGANGGMEPVRQCRLKPVRGYTKAANQVANSLEKLGLVPAELSPILCVLIRNGLAPGGYSSKINILLKPETTAAEAVRCIMKDLVSVMHVNLPGVRQDIDTEFLHDFRVSVRRARSLLSQMRGVLDAGTAANLQLRLKAMGAATGNVRDLDVYLLKKAEYINLSPDVLKPGISRLFKTLKRKRRYARDRMINAMATTDFKNALADLDAFVDSDPLVTSDAPHSSLPIGELAKVVIYKRYRRIIEKGGQVSESTPDKHLHNLRIECKKLRYLLEFFTSLFPEDQMKILVKQLKQLQENLGDFNDLSVQQAFLINYLQSIQPQASHAVMLAAATGGLIARLHVTHGQVRSQFFGVFSEFNASANQKRFETLFT
ncbi:CHAD domain-containing protein [Desulfosarcina sp.]|uniref:CHAD domain-containing protein n=1 Tax=Desulfosarcina sp. TaxID=2027861 RepID=UPI003563946C